MNEEQLKAAAEKYVEETDYINDLNRNLAGNAFIAGVKWSYSQPCMCNNCRWESPMAKELDSLRAQLVIARKCLERYADHENDYSCLYAQEALSKLEPKKG